MKKYYFSLLALLFFTVNLSAQFNDKVSKHLNQANQSYAIDFVNSVEKGANYVSDNRSSLEGKSLTEIGKLASKSNYKVNSLEDVITQGNSTFPKSQMNILNMVNNSIQDSRSYNEFADALASIAKSKAFISLNHDDKTTMSNYLLTLDYSMQYVNSTLRFQNRFASLDEINDSVDWWGSWGKCVASILGGAGTGALGGIAIGSATVTPIGAVAGGIIGGISGGLTGGAAGC